MKIPPHHTFALCAQASDPESRYPWALEHGFALEYTPDPERLELLPVHTAEFRRRDVPVRYHTRYFGLEFGDARPEFAQAAFDAHRNTLDAMAQVGGEVLTVHAGLSRGVELDFDTVALNLKRLVDHGRQLGVTVCLENLRAGPGSDPENILRWASFADSAITMDLGHVVSSEQVKSGELKGEKIARAFLPRLLEVHFYGKEEGRHLPLESMRGVEHIVEVVLESSCRWWTVELQDTTEALATRSLLEEYLRERGLLSAETGDVLF